MISGYLVKTAQCFSTFQRKQFYQRYYELDTGSRQLRISEKQGGQTKEIIFCNVVHVSKQLSATLRDDYRQFFMKSTYHDLTVVPPQDFSLPFAIFM